MEKSLKNLTTKRPSKSDRERAVLLGLVELYLKSGKPVGSNTLQSNGFANISSATIRNYFAKLEKEGYLHQPHTSGGRVPTFRAFRFYADTFLQQGTITEEIEQKLKENLQMKGKEIRTFLDLAAELLSELSHCAVFLSSPKFDQDFIQDVKLIGLDEDKILCVLMTDFGLIHTETIYSPSPFDPASLQAMEKYFLWRIDKGEKPEVSDEGVLKLAQRIYNEIMVRHLAQLTTKTEDLTQTGLSKLLLFPEFSDVNALAPSLALFEDEKKMRQLLNQSIKENKLSLWIGDELSSVIPLAKECSVIVIPYFIHQIPAGAIAIVGPMRIPYRALFGILRLFSEQISEKLTDSVYKYKLSFKKKGHAQDQMEEFIGQNKSILLEDKSR